MRVSPTIQAVFFDGHNVIYGRTPERAHLAEFLNTRGLLLPDKEYLDRKTRPVYQQAARGLLSRSAFFNATLDACGVRSSEDLVEGGEALSADHGNIYLFSGVPETLMELRNRGFKIGIITDTVASTDDKLRWFRSQGLDITWDAFASSVDVGVCKPDRKIYHEALRQANVIPSQSVFVGHKASELMGAKQLGITTIVFNPDPDAEGDFFINQFADLLHLPFLQRGAD